MNLRNPSIASKLQARGNRIRVVAANRAGSLVSRGASADLADPAENVHAPKVFALIAGISDYAGKSLHLTYPGQDAAIMAQAFKRAADEMVGPDRVTVVPLISDAGMPSYRHPTKANIENALKSLQKEAAADDVLLVFLAGHATGTAGGKKGYFFLTSEAGDSDIARDPLAPSYTLSSEELSQLLQDIPANKQAVILDTCDAGNAVKDITKEREVSGQQKIAWERLRDRAGVYVLAGCAADSISYEATNVGHGLLTYSLLEPLDRLDPSVLRPDGDRGFIDIDRWFGYAQDRVQRLIDDLGLPGIQRPEKKPRRDSQTFDVGELSSKDKGAIGLQLPRPAVLLGSFQYANGDDDAALSDAIDAILGDAERSGSRGEPFSYWKGVTRFPNAIRLSGELKHSPGGITVEVRLHRFNKATGDAELFKEFVVGPALDREGLAKEIVSQAGAEIAK